MIDLYTSATPNGHKISIMLEETQLPYKVVAVNLSKGEQFSPEFSAINPNQKIPAIVDHDVDGAPLSVFESGAILVHLAEKAGKFLPKNARARSQVMQWLMYQVSYVGPTIGLTGHFIRHAPEKVPYAIQHFMTESIRVVGVLNVGLAGRVFLGDEYSIADMATYPWIVAAWETLQSAMPDKVAEFVNVKRWVDAVAARPAVQRGMAVPAV